MRAGVVRVRVDCEAAVTAARTLPLVDCPPYQGRLLEERCAERYQDAQRPMSALALSACRQCETGRQRAGIEEDAATLYCGRTTRYTRVGESSIAAQGGRRYREIEVECSCGARRMVPLTLWESPRRPQMCAVCRGKTTSARWGFAGGPGA